MCDESSGTDVLRLVNHVADVIHVCRKLLTKYVVNL